jgi:hypothetical protein
MKLSSRGFYFCSVSVTDSTTGGLSKADAPFNGAICDRQRGAVEILLEELVHQCLLIIILQTLDLRVVAADHQTELDASDRIEFMVK